jgi:muconolactone D-isomerase
MLFHVSFRVEHTRLDRDEFWDEWERETEAALGAIEAGVIKSLYRLPGNAGSSASWRSSRTISSTRS